MKVPGVPFVQGRNRYGTSTKYGIAIHCTANTAPARNEASYATRRTDGVSAHFFVDDREVIQSLDTADIAGHAGSTEGNTYAIAVEITGLTSWSRDRWLKSVAWDRLGRVLAAVARHHGIPAKRVTVAEMRANPRVRGAYDHNQMRQAWGGTDHTDPGPNFPWDHLLAVWQNAMSGKGGTMALDKSDLKAIVDAILQADEIPNRVDDPKANNPHMRILWALAYAAEATHARKAAERAHAEISALGKRVDALAAKIDALAKGGTSLDTGAVLAAVESLRSALATGARAGADALATRPDAGAQ